MTNLTMKTAMTVDLNKDTSPLLQSRKNRTKQRSFSCSFQKKEKEHNNDRKQSPEKSYSLPVLVDSLILKQRDPYSTILRNARRTLAWRKRLEQPWMKGTEMQAFYKIWKLSSQPTSEKKLTTVVHRSASLPRNFKFPGDLDLHDSRKGRKTEQEFGIVRDCCCEPKVRIKACIGYH